MAAVQEDVLASLLAVDESLGERRGEVKEVLRSIEKRTMRGTILDKGERADGRGLDQIRPITC